MMAVHALYAANASGRPTLIFSVSTGRAAAIFAVLAGAGIAFLTGRQRVRPGESGRSAVASLSARALVVGLIGLALGYTDADVASVILPYYAVMFLLAIPLVFLGTRVLAVIAVLIALGMPVLSQLIRVHLPLAEGANPSFSQLFTHPLGLLTELSLTGLYPALPWMAYMCAGMVLGRLRLSSTRVAATLLGVGVALATAAVVVSEWLLGPGGGLARITAVGTAVPDLPTARAVLDFGGDGVTPTTTWWWLAVHAPHTASPPDLLHTTGVAVALVGALLLLGHLTAPGLRLVIGAVLGPLAAAGAMTLTLYTAHVIFMNSPLDVFGARPGYLVQVVAALLFALGWREAVGRGPLEALASWAARRARQAVTASTPDA